MSPSVRIDACDEQAVTGLEESLGIPRLAARLLWLRGFTTAAGAEAFLFPKIEDLSDPLTLPDVGPALVRTAEAIRRHETVGIFGDYDADGISSAALMANFLKQLGVATEIYIPRREEGYGLNLTAVQQLRQRGVSLLMCLDCGTSNPEEIHAARDLGMDTIVIDHHEVAADHADPLALVNPKRPDSHFPTRDLAACGVTFFFLLALRRHLSDEGLLPLTINLRQELDLAALGTLADMVPLVKDNRLIVRFGFETMRRRPRTWVKAFLKTRLLSSPTIDEYAVGFIIGPRINAAGRLSDPVTALEFLISEDESEAAALLSRLDQTNRTRKGIEEGIVGEAVEIIEKEGLGTANGLVVFKEGWAVGVIGIVAQRLVETFAKPAVVLTKVNGTWKGSARGIDGMDLYATVSSLSPLLIRCGGHRYACGLSVLEENLLPFREAFDRASHGYAAKGPQQVPAEAIVSFDELTKDLVRCLGLLAPFGNGNPRPTLLFRPASVSVANRFVKILDDSNRTWYGTLQGRGRNVSGNMQGSIIASPYLREERGEQFINLLVREFLAEDGIVEL